eukprot:2554826-Pyramimonas_sp.AAC.1
MCPLFAAAHQFSGHVSHSSPFSQTGFAEVPHLFPRPCRPGVFQPLGLILVGGFPHSCVHVILAPGISVDSPLGPLWSELSSPVAYPRTSGSGRFVW